MGVKDMAWDALNSLTGNVESAYLEVTDYRELQKSASGEALKTLTENMLVGNLTKEQKNTGTKKTLRVQFNPGELEIYAYGKPVHRASAQPDDDGKQPAISKNATKPVVELSTRLVFDAVNIYDSFMMDKFTGGVSVTTATNAASLIATASGKKKWTVQKEVEGLVAALRNPFTRNVTFRWSKFEFSGQLTSLNVQYAMFSTSGRPVRAFVDLRLHQEMDDGMLTDWYNSFEEAFKGVDSLVRPQQYVENLLGLNL